MVGLIVLGIVGAVLVAIIASLALDRPDEKSIDIEGAGAVQSLFGGIPQEGAFLGSDSAPVRVEVFNDLQCPECAEWQLANIDPLIEEQVRGRQVRLEFHHFPITDRGVASFGAVAAGAQDREWQYIDLFLRNQGEAQGGVVIQDLLEGVAAGVLELDVPRWKDDFNDEELVLGTLDADQQLALDRRLPAQPAVAVEGPEGSRELIDSPTLEQIEAAIAEVS